MNAVSYINVTINIIGAIICLLILSFLAASEHRKLKRSRIFIRIIIVQIAGLFIIIADNILNINNFPENIYLKKALVMLIPLGGPVILMFFIDLILTIFKEKTAVSKAAEIAGYIATFFCIINIISTIILLSFAMYRMTAPSFNLVYDEFYNWFLFSYILSISCMAIGTGLLIAHRKFLSRREFLTLLSYIVLPAAAVLLELYFFRLALINFSITLIVFLYYASIQSELSQQIKQKELELTRSSIAIMFSQIQPHFLYNALSAIAQLCDEDPVKAKKVTVEFSAYLRNNMESLNNKGLIHIEKEIDHVKGYLDLEKAIYGNALNVIYHIEAGDFMLPPLTIQPIVENAVKHGIGKKEGGGTLTLSVRETDNEFLVTVLDNGAGYDKANLHQDSQKHIGIENVRRRLEEQCGGTLEISGEKGTGTTAVIKIPKTKH
ncbi:MAG: histidine kinase [Treponema sp.]|nr:histidine kinase [Treponema sp.]